MHLSIILPETRDVARVVDHAQQLEELGFAGFYLGTAFGIDPITALAVAGAATTRIRLGVSVVPTWPRHPVVMAQQAATANAAAGGRFVLGVGPSHEPVMKMYGIDFDRPIGHLREYLTVLRSLLHDGAVDHRGERYRVRAMLDVAAPGPPPVMLAALREQTCRLAGAHADGAMPWLAPSEYLAAVIAPAVADGAAAADRPAPPIVASIPAVLTTDRDVVRSVATTDLAVYPYMPFYRAMLEHAGIAGAAESATEGWSDAMIDAAIVWGDETTIADRLRAYFDAGAAEVIVSPFGDPAAPVASREALTRLLADLVRSAH